LGILEEDKLEDYITLYNTGININDINPLNNETYKILKMSSTDIRIVNRDENYATLILLSKLKRFTLLLDSSNPFFYMIPIQTMKGTIIGFVFRELFKKNYDTFIRPFHDKTKKVPVMYGFYKDFLTYNKHIKSKPIVICEGIKDCILLKRIYPYVLANNGSSIRFNSHILSNITNKIVLLYDNDETGKDSTIKDSRILKDLNIIVESVNIDDGFKDCSEYLATPSKFNNFQKRFIKTIKQLDKL